MLLYYCERKKEKNIDKIREKKRQKNTILQILVKFNVEGRRTAKCGYLHHFKDDFFMLIFFTVDTRNLSKKYRELCLLYAHMRLFYYVFCLFWVH